MPPNSESSENSVAPSTERLRFLADRMALLMQELVRRDMDYGRFCFEEFFEGEVPDHLRKRNDYDTCLEFVRRMLRRHDEEQKQQRNGTTTGLAVRGDGSGDAEKVG